MNVILGFVIVLGCVAGGFVLNSGQLLALWQPNELLIIGGAALGAFVTSNPLDLVKTVLKSLPGLLKASPFKKSLYMDALALMYDLLAKARKDGLLSLESDLEEPQDSVIFQKYPAISGDQHLLDFITDYLRLQLAGNMNAFEMENLMDVELDTHHAESALPGEALTRVADGLPGFGIVAAVLGIVITMAALGGPPREIGHHVAAALVGTFLGILLAYGFVAPMATSAAHRAREESAFYVCLKSCLLAFVKGYPPQIAVEFGRKSIYASERPGFRELEERIKNAN